MAKQDPILARLREICLALPDTKETLTWGKPHFRVGEKIFSGYGEEKGKPVIGFKLEMRHAALVTDDSRFWPAPYVGHKGWVSMDAAQVDDWNEVREMILESFRLIAPKKTLAKLETEAARKESTAQPARKKKPAPSRKVAGHAVKKRAPSRKVARPAAKKRAARKSR